MKSNQDRIKFLQEKLEQLGSAIEEKKLEDKYVEMAEHIKEEKLKFEPINEEDWEVMLPKEKDKNLLIHYHTMRTELHAMKTVGTKKNRSGKLSAWLESPWTQVGLSALTLAEVAVKVVELAHQSGLFFKEEHEDTNSLV